MKELIFIATTQKLTQKCFRISSSFVIIFIWAGYLDMKVSLTLQYGSKLVSKTIRDIYTYISSSLRIRITNMLLASCNACNVRMWLRQYFFTYWKKKQHHLETLKDKIGKLTDMTSFDEFPSLSLESLSVVTSMHYVCYFYE